MSEGVFQRKRFREDDDGESLGAEQPKPKRQFQKDLAIRRSPENHSRYNPQLNIHISHNHSNIPAPPTITPADSDCDEAPKVSYTDTSTWASDASFTGTPMEGVGSPQEYPEYAPATHSWTSQNSDHSAAYADDYEMGDNMLLSPGPFQADASHAQTLSDRIPTPMNPHFARTPRPQKTHSHLHSHSHSQTHSMDMGSFEDAQAAYGVSIPSPISEDEPSPSAVLGGVGNICMEVEMEMEVKTPPREIKESPPKKGHRRSPYGFNNLANWSVNHGMSGAVEQKKTFSMGYRSDCEKCRDRVPGHFSHIITS